MCELEDELIHNAVDAVTCLAEIVHHGSHDVQYSPKSPADQLKFSLSRCVSISQFCGSPCQEMFKALTSAELLKMKLCW